MIKREKGILWKMRRNEKRREESQAREIVPQAPRICFSLVIKEGCQWEERCDQVLQYLSSRGAGMLKMLWSRLPVRGAPK